MKHSVKRFVLLLALASCDVPLGGSTGGVQAGTQGKVNFALQPMTSVAEGKNDFSMSLIDVRTHKPIVGANGTVRTLMPAMGHETSEATVEEPTSGAYVLRGVVFDMPGDWAIRIQIKRDAITDEVQFPFSVP